MNISALVNQQFSFALTLIEFATDEKKGITDSRFTYHAFVKSVLLQWDLALRYWFEELATSAAASEELKRLFESHQPIHELSLAQLLSRAERYILVTDVSRALYLELLLDYRHDKNSWLCVLENALRSFCVSEREWHEKYQNTVNDDEKPFGGEGGVVGEPGQGVVLIASTETAVTDDAGLQSKHWREIELNYLHQLICDSKQFIEDNRNLNAEN